MSRHVDLSFSRRAVLRGAALAALAALMPPLPALAAKAEFYTGLLSGTAVSSYDPVAYFDQGRPVKGSSSHSTEWKGVTWRFSSALNLAAFKADPERYAPRYGGYCAWAVSQGYTAKGDPRHWTVHDGRLYLNYSADVRETWSRDIQGNVAKGDANWPLVRN
jgi:YHS domain-containing protein